MLPFLIHIFPNIMENQINSGTLESLKPGQTLLVHARKVANGKIQLHFAEGIDKNVTSDGESPKINLLGMLNQADERFQSKPRHAWITAEPVNAAELLGIPSITELDKYVDEVTAGGKKIQVMPLNVLNPVCNGMRFRVQITETIVPPDDYAVENLETRAKRRGADGDFITHQGKYIFTVADVVLGETKNTFLEPDAQTTTSNIYSEGIAVDFGGVDVATGEIFS